MKPILTCQGGRQLSPSVGYMQFSVFSSRASWKAVLEAVPACCCTSRQVKTLVWKLNIWIAAFHIFNAICYSQLKYHCQAWALCQLCFELANLCNNCSKIIKQRNEGRLISGRGVFKTLLESVWVCILTCMVNVWGKGMDLLVGGDLSELRPSDSKGNLCFWKR